MVIKEKPSSLRINGAAEEMFTRSMYVIMYAATVSARMTCRTRVGDWVKKAILYQLEFLWP